MPEPWFGRKKIFPCHSESLHVPFRGLRGTSSPPQQEAMALCSLGGRQDLATADENFPRLQGTTFSHTKIPAGSFILKPLPSAVEKLIWEKWLDDKARKIWLNGLNFIFNNWCRCWSNTGHNPYLVLYHLIFMVTKHVFLCSEVENRGKNPLLTVCSGMGLEQEEYIKWNTCCYKWKFLLFFVFLHWNPVISTLCIIAFLCDNCDHAEYF